MCSHTILVAMMYGVTMYVRIVILQIKRTLHTYVHTAYEYKMAITTYVLSFGGIFACKPDGYSNDT